MSQRTTLRAKFLCGSALMGALLLPLASSGCGGTAAAAASGTAAATAGTLSPATATVAAGQAQPFTASFNGTPAVPVSWSATGGTVSGSGTSANYVAGTTPGSYTVTATAGTATASATVVVAAAAPVAPPDTATISPASATVTAGLTQAFTVAFSGAAPTAVSWSATGGTIAGSGSTGTFTAGTAPGTYTITASGTGPDGETPTATANVTVVAAVPAAPPDTATISPATASLTAGQTQTFTASFSDGIPASVSWSATGGSITSISSGSGASASFVAGASTGTYTVTATAPDGASASASVTIAAAPASASTTSPLFTSSGAAWLYNAATGTGLNISSMVASLPFSVNTHDGGFDYPVQYTDGSLGCTTFTDTLEYAFTDKICVPLVSGGFAPSVGGYGANDGHLVVVNTTTGAYYDFWKLYVDGTGTPTSTNVGDIVSGNLSTSNGTPGTTAAEITGLAGDILPGELDCATCLNHALSVVVPGTMNSNQVGTQAPAVQTDGTVAGAIFREGAKIVFDPTVDVTSLGVSTAVQAILRALQLYGGVITDQTGGNGISFYSALATQPDLTGIDQIAAHLFIYY